MPKTVDEVGLLALSAGHVLLVKHAGEANWRIPRTATEPGEDAAAALGRLGRRLGISVDAADDLGTREIEGRMFSLRRVRIPALPEAEGHELRLVRLSFLPKELMAPDKPLLDALLGG